MKYGFGIDFVVNRVLGILPGINIYEDPGYDLERKSPKSPKSPTVNSSIERPPASIDTIKIALEQKYSKLGKLITTENIKAALLTLDGPCIDENNNYKCSERMLHYGNPSDLDKINSFISKKSPSTIKKKSV